MILDCVTITGADDSVEPKDLVALSERYPFVEWGILFSGKRQGTPRYPSKLWQADLYNKTKGLRLSAHLCGRWVRDLVLKAEPSWWKEHNLLPDIFTRVQLNFHGEYHKAKLGFIQVLREHGKHDFIFQHDGVNDSLISTFTHTPNLRSFPLFDRSGGAGISPGEWPKPIWSYCGYAGGLGPDNLKEELGRISEAVGDSWIWIDMETKVRSDDDMTFDLGKVRCCLELAEPFVTHQSGKK